MKRLVLTLVAVLALFSTVQTAKADWVWEVNSNGYIVLVWDPGFPGSYNPTPPPPPPGTIEVLLNGLWYLLGVS
jgi:hypothetical protein